MDDALKNMISNLEKNTGKPLSFFTSLVLKKDFAKHGEAISFLKTEHGLGHGYANMVVHMAKENSSLHIADDDLITSQYAGKTHWQPLYEKLKSYVLSLGQDVELSPKKAYVSLRRKKQFGLLMPATKTRFEIGLNLKGIDSQGVLTKLKSGGMCSHKIDLTSDAEISQEVLNWIHEAYNQAG